MTLQLSVSSSEFSENANSFFRKFVSRTIFSKNVNGSVFCEVKRNKTYRYASLLEVTCIENRFEPNHPFTTKQNNNSKKGYSSL